MKTSLIIENELFESAKKEAIKTGKTLSEVISLWTRKGRDSLKQEPTKRKIFTPIDLGGDSLIDLTKRRDWIETLE